MKEKLQKFAQHSFFFETVFLKYISLRLRSLKIQFKTKNHIHKVGNLLEYYFTVLLFGLFAIISLQKNGRDRLYQLPVADLFYEFCLFATLLSIVLLSLLIIAIHTIESKSLINCIFYTIDIQ